MKAELTSERDQVTMRHFEMLKETNKRNTVNPKFYTHGKYLPEIKMK